MACRDEGLFRVRVPRSWSWPWPAKFLYSARRSSRAIQTVRPRRAACRVSAVDPAVPDWDLAPVPTLTLPSRPADESHCSVSFTTHLDIPQFHDSLMRSLGRLTLDEPPVKHDELKFAATVSNTVSEPARILKYGTILDDILPTPSFTLTKNGESVPFTGTKRTVPLEDIDDSAFAFIHPGQSVIVNHKSNIFDFASASPGTFIFATVASFQTASPKARLTDAASLDHISVSSSSVDVHTSGDLEKRDVPILDARAVDICTSSSQRSFIDASYTEANSLASIASSYISTNGVKYRRPRFAGCSTTLQANRRGQGRTPFSLIFLLTRQRWIIAYRLSCMDIFRAYTNSVISYIVISTTNITHGTSGTDDIIYGCASDHALSDANQRIDADNYSCLSTQAYENTQC
ncbi:hypothetical protein ARMGADRAFT_1077571 [Armillaria gallica]|uniref:Uncharacterized protein n=1 Tax=Armillaria gallica TaxID=47427 RepID=A0A2H3DPQ1_ARMGA|nr:hypothetical protein ARMGADRAFT_1077571 [Armillaria gallica]